MNKNHQGRCWKMLDSDEDCEFLTVVLTKDACKRCRSDHEKLEEI